MHKIKEELIKLDKILVKSKLVEYVPNGTLNNYLIKLRGKSIKIFNDGSYLEVCLLVSYVTYHQIRLNQLLQLLKENDKEDLLEILIWNIDLLIFRS